MAELPPVLAKRIGPLPVAGWIVVGVAGVGLGIVIRRADLFGGPGEVEPVDELIEDYDDPAQAGELYGGGGLIPIAPQTQPGNVGPAPITTNNEWRIAAIRWAVAAGEDAVLAESAVGHYLAGSRMSYPAGLLLSRIIAALGSAPEGAPVPDIAPGPTPVPITPPTTPTPKPPAKVAPPKAKPPAAKASSRRIYRVQRGDTLWGIAKSNYGNGALWRRIYDVPENRRVIGSNPNLIRPGQVLVIPL